MQFFLCEVNVVWFVPSPRLCHCYYRILFIQKNKSYAFGCQHFFLYFIKISLKNNHKKKNIISQIVIKWQREQITILII